MAPRNGPVLKQFLGHARLMLPALAVWTLLALPGVGQGRGRGWGYGRGNYASTAQQAADYGMASMMRAQGQLNLDNSEAAKNFGEATSQAIDNRKKWTETYFEMRKINRDARAEEAPSRISHEDAIRLAKEVAPPRLGSTQLDPVTGHIEYPLVLQDKIFAPYRSELDSLFADRASSGSSLQFDQWQSIRQTVSKFIEVLKEHVHDYPAGEYGKARVFLNSLSREANLPAG
jgi:hypothetical protein